MKWRPIDDDSKEESAPNKWQEQRDNQAEIGEQIDARKNGDTMNDLFE